MLLPEVKGNDLKGEVLAHVANGAMFPKWDNILYQLQSLMDDGLHIGDWLLQFKLYERHNMSSLVTRGQTGALGQQLCPSWFGTKATSYNIVILICPKCNDNIVSIA